MSDKQRDNALVLLIQSLFDQIDEVAALRKQGHKGDLSFYLLKEMAAILPSLDEETLSKYYEFLTQLGSLREYTPVAKVKNEEFVDLTSDRKKMLIDNIKNKLSKVA